MAKILDDIGCPKLGKVSGKKALILYATISGNSEKIAKVFEQELLDYGFEVDMIKATNQTTPAVIHGYDLYLVGTGIVGGLPELNLIGAFGAGNYCNMRQTALIGGGERTTTWSRKGNLAKGIIFLTYGGNRRGPSEIMASAGLLEMMMIDMDIAVMGKFACTGCHEAKEMLPGGHYLTDSLAQALGASVEDMSIIRKGIMAEPGYPDNDGFKKLSAEAQRFMLMMDKPEDYPELWNEDGTPIEDTKRAGLPRDWHNDTVARPNARDLLKAAIFIDEFVEDIFLPTEAESIPQSVYESIC